MRKSLNFIIIIFFFSISLVAQEAGNMIYNNYNYSYTKPKENSGLFYKDTVIEIRAKALMNVNADSYVAIFSTSQFADTISTCNELLNARIEGFKNGLIAMGIAPENIYVDMITQVPVFDYEVTKKRFSKSFNEIPKGFELKKNIHIAYKNREILNDILILASKFEIYDFVKTDYFLNNYETNLDSLRRICIKSINKKAEDYKKLGIKFTSNYMVVTDVHQTYYPQELYRSYKAYDNASIYRSSSKKGSEYEVKTIQKQATFYYDKLDYKNFDVIINPVVLSPMIQITYEVAIRYVLKKQ